MNDCLKLLSWKANYSSNNKPYVKSCIYACEPGIIWIQEPRMTVSLPHFTVVQSKELNKINTTLLFRTRLEFEEHCCFTNLVPVKIFRWNWLFCPCIFPIPWMSSPGIVIRLLLTSSIVLRVGRRVCCVAEIWILPD